MQCQQGHLLRRLDRHEAHGRALHCFGYCLGVSVVVLVPFEEWFDVLRRDQSDVVSQLSQAAADIVRTRASFHADQAARHIREPALELRSEEHTSELQSLTNL